MCFRVLNDINIKGIQGQPRFWLLGNLIFINFEEFLFSMEVEEPKLGLGVNP